MLTFISCIQYSILIMVSRVCVSHLPVKTSRERRLEKSLGYMLMMNWPIEFSAGINWLIHLGFLIYSLCKSFSLFISHHIYPHLRGCLSHRFSAGVSTRSRFTEQSYKSPAGIGLRCVGWKHQVPRCSSRGPAGREAWKMCLLSSRCGHLGIDLRSALCRSERAVGCQRKH